MILLASVYDGHPANTSIAQFVHNEWIESYDPTIEDSYRTQIQVDVSRHFLSLLLVLIFL